VIHVNVFFHAVWLLCGLGAAVFATHAAPPSEARPGDVSRTPLGARSHFMDMCLDVCALAVGFTAGTAVIRPDRLPDPVWIGGVVAGVASLQLVKPGTRAIAPACAGALAGLMGSLFAAQGIPRVPSVVVCGAVPALSASLSARNTDFAPGQLREDALLIVFWLGLALAMAPGVTVGWQAAEALNLGQKEAASQAVPLWTLAAIAIAAAAGGVSSLWMRR
jgi:hypothetical protein